MSRNIFNPDNALMITVSQITDCIFLSIFWLLGCIPVITIGASCAALYDAVCYGFRKGDKHCWQRFGHAFRSNWKAGIVPTVIFVLAISVLGKGLIHLWNSAVTGSGSWMVFSGAAFAGVLILGILSLLFPVLSRFENSVCGLLKNTFFLAMANLPLTVGLGMIYAFAIFVCTRFVIPLFFMPALAVLISTLLIEPMFKPYMPEEDAA